MSSIGNGRRDGSSNSNNNGDDHSQFAADQLPHIHLQMSRWMELQASQNRVTERMLDMQERVLMAAMDGSESLRALPLSPPSRLAISSHDMTAHAENRMFPMVQSDSIETTVPRAVSASPRSQVATARKPPIPIPVSAEPAPPLVFVSDSATVAVARQAAPAHASTPPAAAAAATSNGEAPSSDVFRNALLKAVSDRTGYPVDVLDETVPLEAGLGIDSIKTVEIFSNLKEYHKYFQDDDASDEDLLEKFSKLKTLRDIIKFYDQRQAELAAGKAAGRHAAGNGAAGGKAHVQRMTLSAVEAPLDGKNGKKKSFHQPT